jgi:hypothetical protein
MTMLDERELEARLTAAMERQRDVDVPEGFAAKVVGALPALKPRRRRLEVGRKVAMAAAAASLLTMFALARHAAPSFANLAFDGELLLMVELAGIAWGFSRGRV